ncbi:hypothetical protein [Marinomonas spartinae]|uniref:hypothetical protein n=1 Tax=Marinomonas spartinae TaxID=1792290 RepID=UPI0018F189FF|nr:hypothetical protein [Marinomonas spartinae]MBJ7556561.1 hypothetical protein [Marinomonas spartinae]
MKIVLEPLQETTIPARGETVVYLSGSEPLLITADGRRAEIPPESQNTFSPFQQVTLQNMGTIRAEFEVLVVDGIYQSHTNGSNVRASIDNPLSITNPIVNALTSFVGSVLNIRKITETLNIRTITETLKATIENTVTARITGEVNTRKITETLNIREITETIEANVTNTVTANIAGLVSTQEKAATSIKTSEKTFSAGESFTIPINTNRRDITITASEKNTDVVTVAGVPLRAGQNIKLENYTGAVTAQAVAANDQIAITEVIK